MNRKKEVCVRNNLSRAHQGIVITTVVSSACPTENPPIIITYFYFAPVKRDCHGKLQKALSRTGDRDQYWRSIVTVHVSKYVSYTSRTVVQ